MKLLLNAIKLAGENFPRSFCIADLLNDDSPLIYVNEAFTKETGYTQDEVMGLNCRFMQGEDTNPETVELIQKAIDERKACYFNIINYKKDKTKFWNRLLLIPVGISESDIRYYIGVQMDVTDQYESFDSDVPYQVLEKTDTTLKDKINDIINYYRSYKYLGMLEDNPEYKVKLKELADDTHKKINEICEYLASL